MRDVESGAGQGAVAACIGSSGLGMLVVEKHANADCSQVVHEQMTACQVQCDLFLLWRMIAGT